MAEDSIALLELIELCVRLLHPSPSLHAVPSMVNSRDEVGFRSLCLRTIHKERSPDRRGAFQTIGSQSFAIHERGPGLQSQTSCPLLPTRLRA